EASRPGPHCGHGRGKLKRFGCRQVGDRCSKEDTREKLVLRHRRRARKGDFRLEAGPADRDARVEALHLRLRMDVELRIRRTFPKEADHSVIEAEDAAGEIVIALDEVGAAVEARCIRETADLQIGRPAAVDPKTENLKIAAADLNVELPWVNVADLNDLVRVEAELAHLE